MLQRRGATIGPVTEVIAMSVIFTKQSRVNVGPPVGMGHGLVAGQFGERSVVG
jgi:hypothetical protein